jgi:hypothetical protein
MGISAWTRIVLTTMKQADEALNALLLHPFDFFLGF